jgi:hypothetical protein
MSLLGFYVIFSIAMLLIIYLNIRFKGAALTASIGFFLLMVLYSHAEDWNWFDYAKRYSVIGGLIAICYCNYHKFNKSIYNFIGLYFLPWIAVLNIGEAFLLDFLSGHYINLIGSSILILSLPNFWGRWSFDKNEILGFGPRWEWPTLYCTWNAGVLLNNAGDQFNSTFLPGLLILAIVYLICLISDDWHKWLYIRFVTLAYTICADTFFPNLFPNTYFKMTEPGLLAINVFNALFACFVLFRTLKKKYHCFITFSDIGIKK